MEQSEVVESKKIVKIRQKPKTQKQILENNKQKTRKVREKESINAVAPLPTRTLNEPVFQEKAQQSKPSSPQPTLEKEEEKSVTLPPSQKNKPEVILDDVLAAVPVNSNDFKRKKEKIESEILDQNDDYDFLYPHMDDPEFSMKIAKHKEFYDTQYDGTIQNIKQYAEKMCNASFELMPHQLFVKNFLSLQTPYNSLLLYHGLGSGKTCSAIGIAAEMRNYMKQVGIKKRILVVASPNVQENFKMQLFDERKLKLNDGIWNVRSCLGNTLLREVNPTSLKNVPREKIVSQIKSIINQYYLFMGYIELANFIKKRALVDENAGYSEEERKKIEISNLKREFSNRLIIIDEVHNIRLTQDNKDTKTAKLLMKVAKYSENLRFVLLSATPMYNSYEEIIWLTNLMNLNDNRGTITQNEVFQSNGEFKEEKKDENNIVVEEGGRALLQRKLVGYVSYVRGENPYTFPYRVYPDVFEPSKTFAEPANLLENLGNAAQTLIGNSNGRYKLPTKQLNGKDITSPLEHTPLYVTKISSYQESAYQLIIDKVKEQMDDSKKDFEDMDKFGFRMLQAPLEALNIVYPSESLEKQIQSGSLELKQNKNSEEPHDTINSSSFMVGKRGLYQTMNFIDDSRKKIPLKHSFQYKPHILEKYGPIFREDLLLKYSSKISSITQIIKKSKGIIMVYSQYIDGGVVPLALALEELGFTRFGTAAHTKPLFSNSNAEPLDSFTMKPRKELEDKTKFKQAKYVLITGDKSLSPQNADDLKEVTKLDNKNGENVKVIIISKAGSEGLDFKNIRQIHLLDPWYNTNRAEQIIGRGVRNLSHCALPFEERNVEIYMHATYLEKNNSSEAADVYVYRLAKNKALKIGNVSRLMKENSVDCIVNIGQTNFSVSKLSSLAENQNIEIMLSHDNKKVKFQIGDKPFSNICDYMENCEYKCAPRNMDSVAQRDVTEVTYNSHFANANDERISQLIRNMFRDLRDGQHFYTLEEIMNYVNSSKQYPITQIYACLTRMVKNQNDYIVDKYGRRGNLINRANVYAFQPVEINDEGITIFERKVPVDYKRPKLALEIPKQFSDKQPVQESLVGEVQELNYDSLLQQITTNLTNATRVNKITTSDQDWYRHASRVINHLQVVHNLGLEEIRLHIICHNVDFLMPNEKLILLSHFYSKIIDEEKLTPVEKVIKKYLDTKMVQSSRKTGFVIAGKTNYEIFVASEEDPSKYVLAQPEDIRSFEKDDQLKTKFQVNPNSYNKIMGFIDMFRNGKEMVYRLKNMTQMQNNVGTRISAQTPGKGVLINYLNEIIGQNMYSLEQSKEIMQLGICVIIEILMRHYEQEHKDQKNWFLNPEKAAYNKIAKYRAPK